MHEYDLNTGPRGLRLRVCRWDPPAGSASGPPTLILHGYLEQAAAWRGVAPRLHRPVAAHDHRGHGLSEHVGPGGWYHFWDYVPDAEAVVDHLGGVVDLIGHSMGGTIATLLAAARPEKVRRLVLIEGLGQPDARDEAAHRADAFLRARTQPPRHGSLASPEAAAARMRKYNPSISEADALFLARRTTRPAQPDDPSVDRPPPGAWTWTWDPLHRGRNPVGFNAELHLEHLRRVTSPTLVVDGADSPFILPDRGERIAALRPAQEVVIPGAGHLVHHDQPEALAAAIRGFLDRG